MSRVVAVICHYWPERIVNVRRAVKDLLAGTYLPDRILVLNNNKDYNLEIEGADVINSQFNSRSRGKLVVALLDVADYYLLLDDDVTVGPKTLECYMRSAHRDCCWGYCGVNLDDGNGIRTYSWLIDEETPCQYFLGSILFMSFYSLVRSLILDERFRRTTEWKHQAEDLLVGFANKSSILPTFDEENVILLNWFSKSMAAGDDGTSEGGLDYLIMRAKCGRAVEAMLEENPIVDF